MWPGRKTKKVSSNFLADEDGADYIVLANDVVCTVPSTLPPGTLVRIRDFNGTTRIDLSAFPDAPANEITVNKPGTSVVVALNNDNELVVYAEGCGSLSLPPPVVDRPFVFEIDTSLSSGPGVRAPFEFVFAASADTNDFIIDWGDGSPPEHVTSALPSHVYSVDGVYTITVKGKCEAIDQYSAPYGMSFVWVAVHDWGTTGFTSLRDAFAECDSLRSVPEDDFGAMSEVTTMAGMFYNCNALAGNFRPAWNTGKCTDFSWMFAQCWMIGSFDLSGLDTSMVSDVSSMFYGCDGATTINLSGCNFNNVINASYMFSYCSGVTIIDLTGCGFSNIADVSGMFSGNQLLETLIIDGCDFSSATTVYEMFAGCYNLQSLDTSKLAFGSEVNSFSLLFSGCNSLTTLDATVFDTSGATKFNEMFKGCASLTTLDVSGFDMGQADDISSMFAECSSLQSIDASGWDTSNVTNMDFVFDATTITDSGGAKDWNIGSLYQADGMYRGVTMSTSEYDALLVNWISQEPVNTHVKFDAGNSRYTLGSAAEQARNKLITSYYWTISDGGPTSA